HVGDAAEREEPDRQPQRVGQAEPDHRHAPAAHGECHADAVPVNRPTQPDASPHTSAPIGMAANSQPSASPPPGGSPKVRSASSGNSALGMPATIAMMSSRKDASSTFLAAR